MSQNTRRECSEAGPQARTRRSVPTTRGDVIEAPRTPHRLASQTPQPYVRTPASSAETPGRGVRSPETERDNAADLEWHRTEPACRYQTATIAHCVPSRRNILQAWPFQV